MKTPTLSAIIAVTACLFSCQQVRAQTNTNVITASALPGGTAQLVGDIYNYFVDASPYFGTNKSVRIVTDALNCGTSWGGFAQAYIPLSASGQANIGFGGAYIKGSFYDATTSLNWGTTWTIPLINQQIYTFLESGPGYNFKLKEPIEQSFAGIAYKFKIGKAELAVNGIFGNVSDISKPVRGGGISFGFKL